MPYKDREAKRRYMAQYYQQKIKTGEIPCTANRKGSYGLNRARANKTLAQTPAKLAVLTANDPRNRPNTQVRAISNPITRNQSVPSCPESNPFHRVKRERQAPAAHTGGAEYKERVPKGFTSLGNGVVMRFIK